MPLFDDPSALATDQVITGNLLTTASTFGTGNTALLSVPIPANAADTGQVFRFRLVGVSSSNGTLTFRVHTGANGSVSDPQAWQSIASASQASYERAGFDGILTVRTIGSSGTIQCEAVGYARSAALLPTVAAAVTTPTVNTTNTWYITLAAACSSGTFTAHQAVVEAV